MTTSDRAVMDNRLRELEIAMSRLASQLEHQAKRDEEHEIDIRSFKNVPIELHEIRWSYGRMSERLDVACKDIAEIRLGLEREHNERIEGQAERKRELEEAISQRTDEMRKMEAASKTQARELRNRMLVATLAFLGVFLTSLIQLFGQLLGGGN